MNKKITLLAGVLVLLGASCRKVDDNGSEYDRSGLTDWSAATHEKLSSPNYSVVFNQSKVLRIDIVIGSTEWAAMQADLAANAGTSTPDGGGALPGGGAMPDSIPAGGPGGTAPAIPDGTAPEIPTGGTAPTVPEGNGDGMIIEAFDPIWEHCSVFFNGKEWYHVGIRYKGNSSLLSLAASGGSKYSFKLDFDQYETEYPEITDQRFYGFKELNINNNCGDSSYMREKVAADLFRSFGIVSAQTSFCEVYVDKGSGPQYFGLYTIVEEVDNTVIKTQLGSDGGNLYKPEGDGATFASGQFNIEDLYKKNNEASADYSDVQALYDILNSSTRTSNADQWKADISSVLNVDEFLKWLAANSVMQNWDTYGKMAHNYYLYNNPSDHRLMWIPWDNNEALKDSKMGTTSTLSLDEVTSDWPLIRYLLDVPEYKQAYRGYVRSFTDEVFVPSRMSATYDSYYTLLGPYVAAENANYSALFDQAVSALKNHAQQRTDAVNSYLQ